MNCPIGRSMNGLIMRKVICDGFEVKIYNVDEDYAIENGEAAGSYHIVRVDSVNTDLIKKLRTNGFRFNDRLLRMKIDLTKTKERRNAISEQLLSFPVETGGELSDEMYKLACETYTVDRRFHLNEHFDSALSSKVLQGYFNDFATKELTVYSVIIKDELLGFTVLKACDNETGENIMGVTKTGIRGKMVAWGLYQGMLAQMTEKDSFKYYLGNVSSSNQASINLHIQLGATVDSVFDEYIKKF